MIDKNNPDIQAYLQEELQKQAEQIAEKILWRNANSVICSPTYEELEYYTGLSRKKIDEIAGKCRYKLMIKESCAEGFLLGQVESFCDRLKEENPNYEEIARTYGIAPECVKEWAQNPAKHAVLELAAQGIEDRFIRRSLHLTRDELTLLFPSNKELREYDPIFQRKEPSDEELEVQYQKMLQKVKNVKI
ncbi:hypothetical protein [Lacrimispora indolis]|uniref:hypothetical protein n=1 Tax=Lacrimispora indolis TaxID=69825 RepID=UPI00356299CE